MPKLSRSINALFETPKTQMPDSPDKNEKIFSVSEIHKYVQAVLTPKMSQVKVVGEITNFKAWRSGHWYFDLKDKNSVLSAVMFKNNNSHVPFVVEDGMEILLSGQITVYPSRSTLQIIVNQMEPIGHGALALAFAQLKKKLEMEGLFNSVNKKQLPFLPSTVGIVTSPQGAALQDMIKILRQRMPKINILLSPTPVQGKGSATAIAQAINRLDKAGLCDIIIVGRGGGSLEDLWAFNEEVVVRSLAKCKTPTISAVGHETDITIADLAADQRASTPSHAAQKAVPLLVDLLANIKRHHRTIHRIESERLLAAKAELALQQSNLLRLSTFLWSAHQKLDQLRIRLDFSKIMASGIQRVLFLKEKIATLSPQAILAQRRNRLHQARVSLLKTPWKARIAQENSHLDRQQAILNRLIQEKMGQSKKQFGMHIATINSLSPLNVLARGYAIVQTLSDQEQPEKIVQEIKDVESDEQISIRLKDGRFLAKVQTTIPLDENLPFGQTK